MRPHILLPVTLGAALLAGCSPDESATSSTPPATTSAPSQAPASAPTQTSKPEPPGIAELPAATIVARAEAALHQARSFRGSGTDVSDGQTTTTDLRLSKTGVHGTITTNGAATRLIVIGKTAYMQTSDEAYRQYLPKEEADAAIERLHGRWLKGPTTHRAFRDLAELGDKTGMAKSLFEGAGPTFSKVGPRTVNGVRCIGLDDGEGVLWVDITNARPVRLQPPEGTKGGMDFSEYNTAPEPKAPPATLVIDVKELE